MKSLEEQIADKCRHFNGVQNNACKAGVIYDSVRDKSTRPFGFPCFKSSCGAANCEKREWLSPEEVTAEVGSIEASIRSFGEALEAGNCPHCGKPCEPRRQVGRCVYGACGHRLYQGKL